MRHRITLIVDTEKNGQLVAQNLRGVLKKHGLLDFSSYQLDINEMEEI